MSFGLGTARQTLKRKTFIKLSIVTAVLACLSLFLALPSANAQFDNPFVVEVVLQKGAANQLVIKVTVPKKHYLYAERFVVTSPQVELKPESGPKAEMKHDPFSEETVGVYQHDFEFRYPIPASVPFPLSLTVEYQGCNETLCFIPQTEKYRVEESGTVSPMGAVEDTMAAPDARLEDFEIMGRESGFMKPTEFIGFLDKVEAGEGVSENIIEVVLRKYGLIVMVLFILLGGFMLNLTPCVLPMIPVNIAIIGAGTQAGSRTRGFALGATYGLGIALVYGILGIVVVLTGSQFGTLNASPWFNLAIAVLFLALSLSMFGVFNIDFSRFQGSEAAKKVHGPFLTALTFGGIAALLAGACVAPILIGVLVFSTELYQRGTTAGLLLPFILGVGMGLPWPFAGAGLSFLPKPGMWMERIKYGFGVVILLAALYYGYLGARLLVSTPAEGTMAEATTEDFTWYTSLDEALVASRTEQKPVFVDVWATWCKSCKAMSLTTFKNPAVLSRLGDYIPLKFQAEDPTAPDIKPVLEALGVKGQPYYVVLEPH